jgi:hypothetical protein
VGNPGRLCLKITKAKEDWQCGPSGRLSTFLANKNLEFIPLVFLPPWPQKEIHSYILYRKLAPSLLQEDKNICSGVVCDSCY